MTLSCFETFYLTQFQILNFYLHYITIMKEDTQLTPFYISIWPHLCLFSQDRFLGIELISLI